MKRILAAAIVSVFAAAASASTSAANGPVIIVDGDTIKVDGVTIRLLDIDPPETYRSRRENELVLGLKAKARLRELVNSGPVDYEPHGHDRYGRMLAHVLAGGTDVSDVLLAEGLALPYKPGPEGFSFPRKLGWLDHIRRHDYEAEAAGLGYSQHYGAFGAWTPTAVKRVLDRTASS